MAERQKKDYEEEKDDEEDEEFDKDKEIKQKAGNQSSMELILSFILKKIIYNKFLLCENLTKCKCREC